ncbi:DUF1015 family protein [bacterium]|nr:MAG: DUF1015 family protein [bacterium]
MAALRPFRGLRYTPTAGALESLVSPATRGLTPHGRDEYAHRGPLNVVGIASPEGHGDDRSKYIRYARAAARLAEWRREGYLAAQEHPSFYRLSQTVGQTASGDPLVQTTLFALADLQGLANVEAVDPKAREEHLRLLEATRTTFEPAVVYFEDPSGTALNSIRSAPVSSETAAGSIVLETIDDPDAIQIIGAAFRERPLLVAEGAESVEAARAFRESLGSRTGHVPEDDTLVALTSLHDPGTGRTPLHRLIRRLPNGMTREDLLAQLASRFSVEPHHNRNLPLLVDGSESPAFGLATEGGLGYLLRPLQAIDAPAATWLHREIFDGLLGVAPGDHIAYSGDAAHAVRVADEGTAAVFLLPRPQPSDITEAHRLGLSLPYRSSAAHPGVPTGLVMWAMGDDV